MRLLIDHQTFYCVMLCLSVYFASSGGLNLALQTHKFCFAVKQCIGLGANEVKSGYFLKVSVPVCPETGGLIPSVWNVNIKKILYLADYLVLHPLLLFLLF